jgi:RNA polymerase sigma-70 factor (ECF subfamily)
VIQAAAYMLPEPPRPSEIDATVLEACRSGDAAAMRALILHYQRAVFAFLSRTLGRGPHVEDLAQEVFLRAFRALPRFDGSGSARLSTWLLTIASRLAVDHRRKRSVPVQPLDDELVVSGCTTPETERRRLEIGRALERAAAQLSADQRDVFVLAEFHGLEMAEIARVLTIPEGTAKTRLFRARERLRALLVGVWEES